MNEQTEHPWTIPSFWFNEAAQSVNPEVEKIMVQRLEEIEGRVLSIEEAKERVARVYQPAVLTYTFDGRPLCSAFFHMSHSSVEVAPWYGPEHGKAVSTP